MALVNYAKKEIQFKIVYYGCGLCGKTTNLEMIHEKIPAKGKGNLTSLATSQDRTLFFDFLPLQTTAIEGFTTKFQMYTVPGQVKYNSTRRLVLRNCDGVVFCADSQWDKMEENLESWQNLSENLELQNAFIAEMPHVMQYNKRDLENVAPVEYMDFLLNGGEIRIPTFEAAAITGAGVVETLNAISKLVVRDFIDKRN
ncbi:MAG: GTPase domain-containing protein [Lentisphaeria bacterium]|nr:ADP-ribosylation factor-like protein [Lentisphaeria bacterium]NQZ67066.1 GTPase domain-containing protein [Lentisphaeria bacterium]